MSNTKKMTLIEHVLELRGRLIICAITVLVLFAVSYFFTDEALEVLRRPLGTKLVILFPTEAFMVKIKVALFCGVFLSLPVIFYEFWLFVTPGLKPTERRYGLPFAAFSFVFFITGAAFAYFKVLPLGLRFLLAYAGPQVEANISINYYVSFVTRLLFAFGIAFEMPLLVLFLTKIKLITVEFLIRKAPYAILLCFILAAILTPPDVFTQMMLAGPLVALYGVSILVCKFAGGQ